VLISDLGDFSVTYRVAGLLRLNVDPSDGTSGNSEAREKILPLISTRSALRRAVLDGLHEAGIEIVSPTFMNQRQLQPGKRFIPATPVAADTEMEDRATPEETTFRDLETRVSVEALENQLAELVEKKQSIESQIKNGGSERELERWTSNLAKLQQAIKTQEREIADAKQEILDD